MYLCEYIKAGAVKSWCLVRRVLLVPSCRSEPGVPACALLAVTHCSGSHRTPALINPGITLRWETPPSYFLFFSFFSSPAMTHHGRQTTTWVRRGDPLLGLPLT